MRRYQQLSRRRARTGWLAWAAWGVIGAIFAFEDAQGGSGWLTLILTAPFWILFCLWPMLWCWLRLMPHPAWVELDEDIPEGDVTARLVQKAGVRYVLAEEMRSTFGVTNLPATVTIPGGDEAFVPLEALRGEAKKNPRLAAWVARTDAIVL